MIQITPAVHIPDEVADHAIPQIQLGILFDEFPWRTMPDVWLTAGLLALLSLDEPTVGRCFAHAFRAYVNENPDATAVARKLAADIAKQFEPIPLVRPDLAKMGKAYRKHKATRGRRRRRVE